MNRNDFVLQIIKFFRRRPCENAESAQNALIILYDYILEKARIARDQPEDSLEWCESWFIIQQVQTWTPLRYFWRLLAEDEVLPIRAAAKGNICEKTGTEYWGDPDLGLMTKANLPLVFSGRSMAIQEKLWNDEKIKRAVQLWEASTQGIKFSPELVISTLSAKPTDE